MSGTLHHLPGPRTAAGREVTTATPLLMTKKQLQAHLGRSKRWVELRMNEGLPSENLDRHGRRMFDVQAVERWLNGGTPKATTSTERISQLEQQVKTLTDAVKGLLEKVA
jgi:hypothetical protein